MVGQFYQWHNDRRRMERDLLRFVFFRYCQQQFNFIIGPAAYFLLTFSVDLDIFSSDKLQASTVYTLQQLWREKNGAKMAIKRMLIPGFSPAKELDTRANQSTCGRLKTIRIRCVWTRKFSYSQKNICRKKKFPDMCGHGLKNNGCFQEIIFHFCNLRRARS